VKFLSVCSGIEAASMAWKQLGWKAVGFSEIEPFPCSLLAHYYPDVPNFGDMNKYKDWPDVSIDLLCGGTPCQSFSVAGLRKGLDDPRGNLMLTFGAIAAKYRPKWLFWENVVGVLSSNGGRDFGAFLGMLGQLGYGFAYKVCDAQYFGVAQRRRRVFVVGCAGDWHSAAAVLFERHSLQGHSAPSRKTRQGVAGTLSARTKGGGGLGTDFEIDGGMVPEVAGTMKSCKDSGGWSNSVDHAAAGYMLPVLHADISPALKARDSKGPSSDGDGEILVPMAYRTAGDGAVFYEGSLTAPLTTQTDPCTNVICFAQNQRDEVRTMDVAGALAAEPGAKQQSYVAYGIRTANTSSNGWGIQEDKTHTLDQAMGVAVAYTTKLHNTTSNNAGKIFKERTAALDANSLPPALLTAMAVRRLTPKECERLMGFPDGYTNVPHKGKPAADGNRYKALGNSWVVPNIRWIGKRIQAVQNIKTESKQ